MLTKYTYLTIVLFLMLINTAWAQLDLRLTAAYGNMHLKPSTGLNITINPANYTTVGLQADYYVSKNFGIGIGIDYYIVASNFDVLLSDYSHKYSGTDNWAGDPVPRDYEFTIRANTPDIIEQNSLAFIDLPVSAIYNIPLFNKVKLATRLGLKISKPLTDSYRLKESDLYTRLYFEEWDLELFEIPAHGLYDSRTDWYPEGELDLKIVFSIFSEVGVDFPASLFNIRISGYFSYGLNDIIDEKETSLIYWREEYNNIQSLADNVTIMQYGVKIGIGLNKDREKSTPGAKYRKNSKCGCGGAWY